MRLHFEEGERELLVARLQLAEDADDATIAQAVAEWVQEEPDTEASGGQPTDDNGGDPTDIEDDGTVVVVDVASYRRLQARDRVAAEVEEAARRRDRDELIEEAIHDGKFGPSRRDHYKGRYDSDMNGTIALIGRLTPNSVPLEERGKDVPTDEVDDTSYPNDWVPEVAARAKRPQSRVHGED